MSTRLSFPLRLNLLRQLHLPLVPLVAWQTELCKVLKKVWQSITDFSLLPIQKTVCVCVPGPTKCWQLLCFCGLIALIISIILHDNIVQQGCVFGRGAFMHIINQSVGGNVVEILKVSLNNGTCVGVRSWFWHQIISNTDNTHSISVWHTLGVGMEPSIKV